MFVNNTKLLVRVSYTSILSLFFLYSNSPYAQDNGREFAGINFGVGISLTLDSGNNDRIGSAIVDENGIVRISQEQNKVARIMLESHYFFEPKSTDFGFLGMADGEDWGHGPFVALQPGTDEIIEAIGLGWMVGFRKNKDSNASWNLGIGIVIDPSVNVLADGIMANKALPIGETQIRLKETSQTGIFFITSFNF
jgi:hypothetical protein